VRVFRNPENTDIVAPRLASEVTINRGKSLSIRARVANRAFHPILTYRLEAHVDFPNAASIATLSYARTPDGIRPSRPRLTADRRQLFL
jgi:hypothetical protein